MQRAFAEQYVIDSEKPLEAAWRAGYCGGSPDADPPDETPKRRRLADRAHRLLEHAGVLELIDELQTRAAATFLASPAGAAVVEAEAHTADVVALAAKNLAVMVAVAHHDIRSAVQWGQGWITVTDSESLTYEEALLIREVKHEQRDFGEAGVVSTTMIKIADRAPYVKMLEQRVGKTAPIKVEHSGPGGGAVEHEHRVGPAMAPSDELIDEVSIQILGVVPATRARPDDGIPAADVIRVLEAWELDGDALCEDPADLFRERNWEETRARYLVSDD